MESDRYVDPKSNVDILETIEETLREHPMATSNETLAAWRVRRGVPIDEAEVARVMEMYEYVKTPPGEEHPLKRAS